MIQICEKQESLLLVLLINTVIKSELLLIKEEYEYLFIMFLNHVEMIFTIIIKVPN